MKEKVFNLKNDIIFKAFFSRRGNEEFLIDFLNALLGIEILKIDVKEEVNLEQLSKDEKGGRLDLQAKLNDGIIANIELQMDDFNNMEIRTTFYASKIMSREVRRGTDYQNIEKIIMISILGYNMFKEFSDEYIHKTAIVLDKHRDYNVIDSIEWWFIELPKFRKINPDMSKKINQWIAFIDDEDKELIKMAEKNNKVLKKARKEITYLTGDDEVRRLAELREKWDMEFNASMQNAHKLGEKIGTEIGMKKGEKLGLEKGEKLGLEKGEKLGLEKGEKLGLEKGEKLGLEKGEKLGLEKGEKLGIEKGEKLGLEKGEKLGLEKGKSIGLKEEKIKIAKKMLKKGNSIEDIIEITELSKKEIEEIRKHLMK